MTLTPDEIGEVWELIEEHIELEKKTVELAEEAIALIGESKGMQVQSYLLQYLLEDDQNHNTILDRLDNLSDGDFKERIRGEALFIRSLFYYHLAVIWGNVPLQLEAVVSPNVEVNQVSAGVIY